MNKGSWWVVTALGAAVVVLLLALPAFAGGYWLRVLTLAFIFAALAESVNVIAGYTGYAALGNVVFFGTGAYVVAIVMSRWGWPFSLGMLLAGLVCTAYAVVFGLPILRLSGRYFLMASLGLMEITREVVLNLGFTGGGQGITLPVIRGGPAFANAFFYYVALGLMVAVVVVTWWVDKHHVGLALKAVRFDEEAARVMGINTTLYKTVAWGISAFFTGLAGGVFAYFMSYIDPATVYDITLTVKMYIEHIFGGAGTVLGPVIGATIMELISEVVWARFLELHYLILGTLVILITLFMPRGLMYYTRGLRLTNLLNLWARQFRPRT